jgi:hypothetical protein
MILTAATPLPKTVVAVAIGHWMIQTIVRFMLKVEIERGEIEMGKCFYLIRRTTL